MVPSQALGSELSAEKCHRNDGFRCQLQGTAGPQCHISQHHQELYFEFPSCAFVLLALEAVMGAVAPGGPESALPGGKAGMGTLSPLLGSALLRDVRLACFSLTQSGLLLGFRGHFKKAFEIGSPLHVPQEPLVVILILVAWSCVCAWE